MSTPQNSGSAATPEPKPILHSLELLAERARGLAARPDLKRGQLEMFVGQVRTYLIKIYGKEAQLLASFPLPAADLPESFVRGEFEKRLQHMERIIGALKTLVPEAALPLFGDRAFIGHGRSLQWHVLKDFLQDTLRLHCEEFNRESPAGYTTTERLQEMLLNAAFAFLVMTAEDEQADGTMYARRNVIHEAGLFQGRLGWRRAIVLLEDGCSDFSNIHGLTHIPFPQGHIAASFEEIRRVLRREGLTS